ncbi:MAG: hypothetical protein PHY64_07505 [Eubacteriales bacterium]|nr:hypothetical protein [Eubacteriales bacterium]
MKRKGLFRLLSILIALLLPISAMAQGSAIDMLKQAKEDGKEIVSTVTFEPGALLNADQMVTDLCAATAIRLQKLTGGYGALTLALSGEDMITAQVRVDENGLYVQSEVLGETPLYFTWDDIENGIVEAMKSSGMDEDMMTEFSKGFSEGFKNALAFGEAAKAKEDGTMTEDEISQKIVEMMGWDESILTWANGIKDKAVVTNGSFTIGDSDTADTQTVIQITGDDLVSLFDTQFMKDQLTQQQKAQDSSLTDEEVAKKVDDAIAEMKDAMGKSDFTMQVTQLTNGEDEFVAMQYNMVGNFSETEVKSDIEDAVETDAAAQTDDAKDTLQKMEMSMQVISKTLDNGKQYTAVISTSQNDALVFDLNASLTKGDTACTGTFNLTDKDQKPLMTLNLTSDYTDASHVTGQLSGAAYDGDDEFAFLVTLDQTTGDNAIDTAISFAGSDDLAALTADPTSAMAGTLKVNTVVQDDSGFFTALAAATPDSSVELMKLSDADMATFTSTLETNFMSVVYKMFANLPDSVAQALTTEMGN